MKLIVRLFWLLTIAVWLAACQVTPTVESTPELEPSSDASMPTITPTLVPTETSVPSPVPSVTPIPPSATPGPPIGTLIQIMVDADLPEGSRSWQVSGVEYMGGPEFSPDGDKLALASSDGVMIYNANTLDLVSILHKDNSPYLIKWSPDGSLLAIHYFGDDLSIWEPDSSTEVSNFMMRIPPVNGKLSWSPEGDRIGMDIIKENAAPSILDSMTGNPVLELEPIGRYCPVFAFSPDGKSLAGGCYNGGDGIWDATTGEQLLTFDLSIPPEALVSWIMDIVWSSQGDRVAFSVVKHGTAIEIFDATTGQTLADFPAHKSEIFELIWTPDGERLISASHDNTIRIWNLETLEEIKIIARFGDLKDIALSPDGKQLIVIRTDGILIQIDMAALLDG